MASFFSAVYLYSINNPPRQSIYEAGFSFELIIPLLAGGITGAVVAFTAVMDDASACIYVGQGLLSLGAFISMLMLFGSLSFYDVIDWLWLPFVLSIGLLTWGILQRNKQKLTAN
jgi:hypothetical protein